MSPEDGEQTQAGVVLGQKYAYATASLLVGIAAFINLLGLERAILAIVFGWLALKSRPAPRLSGRRLWAKLGLVLGAVMLVAVPTALILFFDRFRALIEALEKLP